MASDKAAVPDSASAESGAGEALTHVDTAGRAHMVDVSEKQDTARVATAEGRLLCSAETLDIVERGAAPKGAVVQTAELAGVMAAKQTSTLIPMCHPLLLTSITVRIVADPALPGFRVVASVKTKGQTGVEMEALTAVSVACLTLFDMLKAVDRTMRIEGIQVTLKSGGRSGVWQAQGA
ncbi:cyclic pyranopterin monophosphate synthase MoaC [Sphingomonas sp. PAMC 26605]|uniref:cyclic pyranopterin monophosphate synthase MoaC n=1 Tax=Sphingomonas sp. PAMC 26605 TaxID=1112214 RepID=UPI00026CD114|nr:cyclic pyranopterin monophosphate synthase MoaC [Sphingomonas sp. PAMC 26605]